MSADLIARLRCRYPVGPIVNGEPEFGWRDMSGPVPWGAFLPLPVMLEAADEIERLQKDLEAERMRLAACGVVARANTPESAASARQMHSDYWSASCADVAAAVDREMKLRNAALGESLVAVDTRNAALEEAARVCDERERRADTRFAQACYRLCARNIRELKRV